MKKFKYLGCAFITFMIVVCYPKAVNLDNQTIRTFTSNTPITVTFRDVSGTLTCTSSDSSVFTITDEGVITPVGDGKATASCSDQNNTVTVLAVVNMNGTLTADATELLEGVTGISMPFVSSFKSKTFEHPWGNHEYGKEMLQLEAEKIIVGHDDFSISAEETTGNNIKLVIKKQIPFNGYYVFFSTDPKTVSVTYKESIDSEANIISNAISHVKSTYNVYLNDLYDQMLETSDANFQSVLIKASGLETDLGNKSITYKMDARYGDNSIINPMFGGIMVYSINSKIYDASLIEFHKAFKIPTVKEGENTIDVIKKYFEENLIQSNEKVTVEEVLSHSPNSEDYYTATITQKQDNSLVAMIYNFFMPKVKADGEKVIAFTVEETDEDITANPKTGDGIMSSILIGGLSLAALAGIVLFLKKRKQFSK